MSSVVTGLIGNEQEERNRKLVLDFYQAVIIGRQFDRWPEFLHPNYIQHKPILEDGPLGVLDFLRRNHERFPQHSVKVLRSFVDGDYVILHVHVLMQPFHQDVAVMDIFRVENGKLVEHWDVDQLVPSQMAHSNGMF